MVIENKSMQGWKIEICTRDLEKDYGSKMFAINRRSMESHISIKSCGICGWSSINIASVKDFLTIEHQSKVFFLSKEDL